MELGFKSRLARVWVLKSFPRELAGSQLIINKVHLTASLRWHWSSHLTLQIQWPQAHQDILERTYTHLSKSSSEIKAQISERHSVPRPQLSWFLGARDPGGAISIMAVQEGGTCSWATLFSGIIRPLCILTHGMWHCPQGQAFTWFPPNGWLRRMHSPWSVLSSCAWYKQVEDKRHL